MLNIGGLLEEMKAEPYVESGIYAPHCGVATFANLGPGAAVVGPSGAWSEKPGTMLARLEREHNSKDIRAAEKGEIVRLAHELEGTFVEAGAELARVRHFLTKSEVLRIILQKALYLFTAPERARYYLTPAADVKLKVAGPQSIHVQDGMELFIMSRMKREMPLRYSGPDGVIYAVYFSHTRNVDVGEPLIGVCPPDMVANIEDVKMRVQTEWPEA